MRPFCMLLLLFLLPMQIAFSSEQDLMVSDSFSNGMEGSGRNAITETNGLMMLDYETIPTLGDKRIDLHGIHYLQQMNDWLFLGVGLHAPMIDGNYGGFMAFGIAIHAQRKIFDSVFVDAGVSFGGGAGGESINKVKELSGTGAYVKGYIGLGYEFESFAVGVNYVDFRFTNSPINHDQLDVFVQKHVSYLTGPYASSGDNVSLEQAFPRDEASILTLELNNMFQISPSGSYKGPVNLLSIQATHFFTENQYFFFGLDAGYAGLPLYNQALGGLGYKFSISPEMNLYGQVAVGSGGYAPSRIDTGPGLLVYPKLSAEYLFSKRLGLSLSSGFLVAPMGASRNFTLGAAINYHRSAVSQKMGWGERLVYQGYRFNLFPQTKLHVRIGDKDHPDIHMLTSRLDYILNDHWYLSIQGNIAVNAFLGYPGYGEIFVGLGAQTKVTEADGFQSFGQILVGANVHGIILNPSVGFTYALNDNFASYAQLGTTISVTQGGFYPDEKALSSYSVGLGLSYRFSLLNAGFN